jgi:hypothetical protein
LAEVASYVLAEGRELLTWPPGQKLALDGVAFRVLAEVASSVILPRLKVGQ